MSLQLADQELLLIRAEDDGTDYGAGDGSGGIEFGEDAVSNHLRKGDSSYNGTPTAEDVYLQDFRELSIDPQAINDAPERLTWSKDGNKAPFIKDFAEFELELPLTAKTTKGQKGNEDVPAYNDVLRAMNLVEDATPSSSSNYTPQTPRNTSITLYQFIRNAKNSKERLRRLTGGVLGGEISISTGEEATMSLSGMGYYDAITSPRTFIDPTNSAASPLITQDYAGDPFDYSQAGDEKPTYHVVDETPLIPKNMVFQVSGNNLANDTTFDISELTIDFNLTQDAIDAVTDAPGEKEHVNTRGAGEAINVGFTLANLPATEFDNFIADYEAAQQFKLVAELQEVGGSRSVKITLPKCQFGVESPGENGNLRNHEWEGRANRDLSASKTGDNAIKIEYL